MLLAAWYAALGAKAATIGRLFASRLWRRYPAFTLFVILSTLRTVLMMTVGNFGPPYRQAWSASLPIVTLLMVIAGIEAIVVLCKEFPGFASIAPVIYSAFLIIAGLILWFTADLGRSVWADLTAVLTLTARYVFTVLAVVMIMSVRFFSQRGLVCRRNALLHPSLYCGFLGAMVAATALYHGGWKAAAEVFNMGGSLAFFIAWPIMMKARGEAAPERPPIAAPVDATVSLERLRQLLGTFRRSSTR